MNFCSVCAEQASKDYGKKRLKFKVSDDSSQSQWSNFHKPYKTSSHFGLSDSVTYACKPFYIELGHWVICFYWYPVFVSKPAFQSLQCISIVHIIKIKLHVSSKIWMLCSNGTNIISFLALNHDIFFLPLKHKIHIFLSPYNILYIYIYIYMFRNRGLLSVFIASSKH